MAVFEIEENSEQDSIENESDDGTMVSVISHQGSALRNTIPKEVREQHRMTSADHLYIEPTEDGFHAEIIQR